MMPPQQHGRSADSTSTGASFASFVQPHWEVHEGFRLTVGDGPVVAVAVHDGHDVRPEVAVLLALDESQRLREEDPHTGEWTRIAPTRVIATRSRFEVDLNRPRDKAVYLRPEDAWGLQVWKEAPSAAMLARSLAEYDAFYA